MNRLKGLWRNRVMRMLALPTILMMLGMVGLPANSMAAQTTATGTGGCTLGSQSNIKHVIYIQFDNVHFTRDNPNVPSDLEQMPNLLNFMESNGTLLTNQHTPLISHTADDILTSLTGVYGDQHGVPIANSFRYFNPNGTSNVGVSFAYWTDPIFDPTTSTPTDTTFNMLTANGLNAPAPWVPYTRAGCNFGAAGTANIELENTATDIPTVFGPNSPQEQEVKNNPNQASADFIGVAVHCAKGNALCSNANTGVADKLPNEPGGYTGYNGLFGHKYVAPQISPNGPLKDLNGNVIKDPTTGDIGFPGFDGMEAPVSLAYVAAMQEHNVPITYAYISDAHDNHVTGNAFGPGEAGYVAQLKSYDNAFGKFFTRLAKDGINKSNSLFVFTADEGDHFVGGAPQPTNCDGVTIPCTYSQIGEVNGDLSGLLGSEQGITTPFKVHSDSAPVYYVTGNPASNNETVTRPLERAVGQLTAVNPYTGHTDTLTQYLADPVEMNFLHMITADPARKPTFTQFADPNYFLFSSGATNCSSPCITIGAGFAWNHGDVSPDINTTWLGMVGPGVQRLGQVGTVWSDHTDTRPTMMELLGLKDDYSHEGRVLFEIMQKSAMPPAVRDNLATLIALGQSLKQIDAPVGTLGLTTLSISTTALESNSPNDSTYTQLEQQLSNLTVTRNFEAGQMLTILENAEFGGGSASISSANANQLISQANGLIAQAKHLKATR